MHSHRKSVLQNHEVCARCHLVGLTCGIACELKSSFNSRSHSISDWRRTRLYFSMTSIKISFSETLLFCITSSSPDNDGAAYQHSVCAYVGEDQATSSRRALLHIKRWLHPSFEPEPRRHRGRGARGWILTHVVLRGQITQSELVSIDSLRLSQDHGALA